jgi:hypothetical protein
VTPASTPASPAGPAGPAELTCPTCGTDRPSSVARFCEVCRYDFANQKAGEPPVAVVDPIANPISAPSSAQTVSGTTGAAAPAQPMPVTSPAVRWDVVIAVDPHLDVEPDPNVQPPQEPERRMPLDLTENLVGRRNDAQGIVPEIRPHDPGVSRRHAKLLVRSDGTVAIVDLDSANGTFVNDKQITAGVPRVLTSQDSVTMGRWTRLRVEPRTV